MLKLNEKDKKEIKKIGLKRGTYMKTEELIQWMKLGFLSGELCATVEATKDKVWHKKLKTAYTYCNQVLLERLDYIEPKQMKSIVRRKDHSELIMLTSDQRRMPTSATSEEMITVAREDLNDLTDLALNSCAACPQGECVKNCFYRTVMHRMGLPVCRDELKEGECEFNWQKVGETQQIAPMNERKTHYYLEDGSVD